MSTNTTTIITTTFTTITNITTTNCMVNGTLPAQPRTNKRTVVISAPEGVPPEDIQGMLQAAVDPVQED